ncbi:Fur family transcriptional regulator [Auraticoccus monumenti]|uniref:Fur family transcriptional regulator, ferric uptake regulator n=1 Tax=Auraticoccus monumenti TaxID=675864 RepID=A0A1G7EDH7_9ACTN|nr:Fur family transcriptional regulator [Auraticoccus monumenti]SDE61667.1 Fur family transcriptional regulator, ferric uptake regulator [Auraticoccus monumenti]
MTSTTPQRRTRQQAAVADALSRLDDFRSAQQIHSMLRDGESPVGLATVYRTLQSMADAGAVDTLRTDDGELRYRQCSTGHHHHLVCRSCGRTVEVSAPEVERWAARAAESNGFRDLRHDLEVYGTCSDC